jgi:hypothetical protein
MAQPSHDYSYDYCKLDNNGKDLRILEIIDSGHELIECRLVKHDDKTPYHALSWCWGAPISQDNQGFIKIIHENQPYAFAMSKNLETALRRLRALRDPQEKSKPWIERIWIDFICINQNDTSEKNSQVPMMAQIYSEAKSVFVWLGEARDKSTEALNFIKNRVLNIKEFDTLVMDERVSLEWAALNALMKREWFSRRWVVQEIALARDAELLCGDRTINWLEFADAVSLFNQVETQSRALTELMRNEKWTGHKSDFFGHIPAFSATRLVNETNNLFLRRDGGDAREARLSLEYLVSNFTAFHASQPRDTVYALLAIAKDTLPEVRRAITDKERFSWTNDMLRSFKFQKKTYNVDYAQPISDVYVEFVRFSIEKSDQSRALDIICRPWAPDPKRLLQPEDEGHWRAVFDREGEDQSNRPPGEGLDTIPSWIPSVRGAAYGRQEDDGKMTRINANTLVGIPPQRFYMAAGSRVVTDKLRFEHGVTNFSNFEDLIGTHYHSLFVEGFVLDVVEKTEPASQGGNIPQEWHKLARRHQRKSFKIVTKLPEDFWRTLVGDRDPVGNNAPRFYPRLILHALKSVEQGNMGQFRDFYTQTSINDSDCKVAVDALRRVQSVIWNRRLMITRDPSRARLGLVPKAARKGDLICILYGCSVPVLLRKFEKTEDEINDERGQRKVKAEQAELKRREEAARTILRALARKKAHKTKNPGNGNRGNQTTAQAKERPPTPEKPKTQGSDQAAPDKTHQAISPGTSAPLRARATLPSQTVTHTKVGQAYTWPHAASTEPNIQHHTKRSSTSEQGSEGRNMNSGRIQHERSRCTNKCDFALCAKCGFTKEGGKTYAASSAAETRGNTLEENDAVFYQLIGECYVHGMMNGEALDLQAANAKTMNRVLFEIR